MQGIWLIAFVLQWIVLLVLVLLISGILRYLSSVQERIELVALHVSRFELGEHVSDFELPDLRGRTVTSKSLLGHGQRVILLFLSTTCGSCRIVARQVAELAQRDGGLGALGWSFIFINYGELVAIEEMMKENVPSENVTVLIDNDEAQVSANLELEMFLSGLLLMDADKYSANRLILTRTGSIKL